MFQGPAARAALALLTAALLTLVLAAPAASLASAQAGRHTGAAAQPGGTPLGASQQEERATARERAPAHDPAGPVRARPCHRTAGPPPPPARGQQPAAAHEAAVPGVPSARPPRPLTGTTPAVLQVFRC